MYVRVCVDVIFVICDLCGGVCMCARASFCICLCVCVFVGMFLCVFICWRDFVDVRGCAC